MRRVYTSLLHLPVLAACAYIFLLTACAPDWLPDSSGLVFARRDSSVVHYDVKNRLERQVVPARSANPIRPALSPDGKQVAVALYTKGDAKDVLQVFTYDLNGKEQHASAKHEFVGRKQEAKPIDSTMCHWSPDGKRLLVFVPAAVTALSYDFGKQSFRTFLDVKPIGIALEVANIYLTASPISPDSKGFLAARDEHQPSLIYWRWEGDQPDGLAMEDPSTPPDDKKIGLAPHAEWSDGAFMLRLWRDMLKLDPAAKKVTRVNDARTKELVEHAIKHQVLVIGELADKVIVQMGRDREVQVWRPDREQPIKIAEVREGEGMWVAPAPNRRLSALHLLSTETRVVIFDAGGVVAKLGGP